MEGRGRHTLCLSAGMMEVMAGVPGGKFNRLVLETLRCGNPGCEALETRSAIEFRGSHDRGAVAQVEGLLAQVNQELRLCPGCRMVRYCSVGCRQAHRLEHEQFCGHPVILATGTRLQRDFMAPGLPRAQMIAQLSHRIQHQEWARYGGGGWPDWAPASVYRFYQLALDTGLLEEIQVSRGQSIDSRENVGPGHAKMIKCVVYVRGFPVEVTSFTFCYK